MTTPVLEQVEADIEHLSLAEQLRLMERLVHRIRTCTLRTPPVQESDLEWPWPMIQPFSASWHKLMLSLQRPKRMD